MLCLPLLLVVVVGCMLDQEVDQILGRRSFVYQIDPPCARTPQRESKKSKINPPSPTSAPGEPRHALLKILIRLPDPVILRLSGAILQVLQIDADRFETNLQAGWVRETFSLGREGGCDVSASGVTVLSDPHLVYWNDNIIDNFCHPYLLHTKRNEYRLRYAIRVDFDSFRRTLKSIDN